MALVSSPSSSSQIINARVVVPTATTPVASAASKYECKLGASTVSKTKSAPFLLYNPRKEEKKVVVDVACFTKEVKFYAVKSGDQIILSCKKGTPLLGGIPMVPLAIKSKKTPEASYLFINVQKQPLGQEKIQPAELSCAWDDKQAPTSRFTCFSPEVKIAGFEYPKLIMKVMTFAEQPKFFARGAKLDATKSEIILSCDYKGEALPVLHALVLDLAPFIQKQALEQGFDCDIKGFFSIKIPPKPQPFILSNPYVADNQIVGTIACFAQNPCINSQVLAIHEDADKQIIQLSVTCRGQALTSATPVGFVHLDLADVLQRYPLLPEKNRDYQFVPQKAVCQTQEATLPLVECQVEDESKEPLAPKQYYGYFNPKVAQNNSQGRKFSLEVLSFCAQPKFRANFHKTGDNSCRITLAMEGAVSTDARRIRLHIDVANIAKKYFPETSFDCTFTTGTDTYFNCKMPLYAIAVTNKSANGSITSPRAGSISNRIMHVIPATPFSTRAFTIQNASMKDGNVMLQIAHKVLKPSLSALISQVAKMDERSYVDLYLTLDGQEANELKTQKFQIDISKVIALNIEKLKLTVNIHLNLGEKDDILTTVTEENKRLDWWDL